MDNINVTNKLNNNELQPITRVTLEDGRTFTVDRNNKVTVTHKKNK